MCRRYDQIATGLLRIFGRHKPRGLQPMSQSPIDRQYWMESNLPAPFSRILTCFSDILLVENIETRGRPSCV